MASHDTSQRKVVVIVSHDYLHDRETGTFAARITPLGLTAYGMSQEEASTKVKKMFVSAVETRRTRGSLTRWLDNSGLDWYWFDEYEGDVPVEDATHIGGQSPIAGVRQQRSNSRTLQKNPTEWQSYKKLGVAA